MNQNRLLKNRGRQIILLSNQSYLDQKLTEYISELPCPRCNLIVYREDGKHYGQCHGCGAYNFKFYQLTPTQQAIVSDDSEIVISYGAMNNGKTDAFIYKVILLHGLRYSNASIGVLCHSLESIQQTVMPTIKQFLPEGLVKKRQGKLMWNNKQITFRNGSTMVFFPSDERGKIRSFNASTFLIPEAPHVKKAVAIEAAGRLRRRVLERAHDVNIFGIMEPNAIHGKTKNVGQLLMDGNPVVGSWIEQKYLPNIGRIYITKESNIEDYLMVLSAADEMNPRSSLHNYPAISNPYVLADEGKYLKIQETAYKSTKSLQYQQNVMGQITAQEGLVYPNYRSALITPFALDFANTKIYFGSDLGFSNACATVMIAEHQRTGMLYVFGGYKERGLDVRANAEKIKNLASQFAEKQVVAFVCDSQGSRRTHESEGGSVFLQYAGLGVYFHPASKNRDNTILHLNTLINEGRLKIFNNLDFLIQEFPKFAYQIKEKTGERAISRRDCDTLDALRYGVEIISNRNIVEEHQKELKFADHRSRNPYFNQEKKNNNQNPFF